MAPEGGIFFKPLAPSQDDYALNPDLYSGVEIQQTDRDYKGEIKGFQLDDAFRQGVVDQGWVGAYGAIGLFGDVIGIDTVKDFGQANADRLRREISRNPKLRNIQAFDPVTGEWTLDGAWNTTEWALSNFALSLPLMAVTAVAFSPPVLAASFGTSALVPVLLYGGLTYADQVEKDPGRAILSGIGQAALDRLGLKAIGVDKLFTKGGRTTIVKGIAKDKSISEKAAEKLLTNAIKTESQILSSATTKILKDTFVKGGSTLGAVAKGAGGEAVTEAAQELIGIWGENSDIEGFELENRLKNAAVTGGVIGGGISGISNISTQAPNLSLIHI